MIPLDRQIMENDGTMIIADRTGPTVSLLAVGDLAFHKKAFEAMGRESPRYILEPVRDLIRAADVAVGNLESVLIEAPYSPLSSKACLISGLKALEGLEDAGFNVLTFANNHVLDAGPEGLVECLEGLESAGFHTTGSGRNAAEARIPVTYEVGDFRFRFHAFSYGQGQIAGPGKAGCNESRLRGILRDLREFKQENDIPVVCLHMDAEFQATPAPDRMEMCHKLAEAGVPIILCHHPHVPQGIEVFKGSLIVYSLGNYVFPISANMRKNSTECHLSFHIEIHVDLHGPVKATLVPVTIDNDGRPIPATGSERKELLQLIAHRSRLLTDSNDIARRYHQMVRNYTRQMGKNIYWCIGERNWGLINTILNAWAKTPTKRTWMRHYFQRLLFGR